MEDNFDTFSITSLRSDAEDLLNLLKSWNLESMFETLKSK